MNQEVPSLLAALVGGLVSFISPCVLPLVPAYLSFISGVSIEELQLGNKRFSFVLLNTLFFVAGFTVVFLIFGAAATGIGQIFAKYKYTLEKAAGVIVVILGIHLTGLFRIRFLDYEKRPQMKAQGFTRSFVIGFAFALGWTPCVGPILGAILSMAALKESLSQGIFLLFVYSMGLGIPFILSGIFVRGFFSVFQRVRPHLRKIEIISGILLIVLGILIFFGQLQRLAYLLPQIDLPY